MSGIAGYTFGDPGLTRSPISLEEFESMKKSALFGEDDLLALRQSFGILEDQVEAVLDVWYGFVGANPHLLASFSDKGGKPLGDYLGAVRRRFAKWILDTAQAEYGQDWLNYQYEIGLRHHRTRKNVTDSAPSVDIIPFRDLFLLIVPVTFTLRPFLANKGHSAEEVEKMAAAWLKSCMLQMTLWTYPYVKDGDY